MCPPKAGSFSWMRSFTSEGRLRRVNRFGSCGGFSGSPLLRKIRDQQLAVALAGIFELSCVGDLGPFDVEIPKQFSGFRPVVERENKLAPDFAKPHSEQSEISFSEVVAVKLR